ncbi:hypothetical protein LCGC14_1028680 [marine sediment metagenome]|uniref:Uncharacterized protein n=1 Tax=marine sediment metagenome TaxID=412755 RepID=A0A0F9MV80_9ZZZZ
MGDRAMAEIKTEDGSLYVYTHWTGKELPDDAKQAVKRAQPRWDDEPYATRIIVDQLTKEGRDQETGYGLMLAPNAEDSYNNDEPSVIIDLIGRVVTIKRDGEDNQIPFGEL